MIGNSNIPSNFDIFNFRAKLGPPSPKYTEMLWHALKRDEILGNFKDQDLPLKLSL